jgi:tetratricopeptide (TPR) repeat protein
VSEDARHLSLRIDRFMRLPRRSVETWQGGVVGLPLFTRDGASGEPVRRYAISWANLATNDVTFLSATPVEARDRDGVLDALLDLGLRNRKAREGRPARLEVQDGSLGAFIKEALRDSQLEVVVLPALPRIQEEIDGVIAAEYDGPFPPGALEAEGVTVERMRAFADAAERYVARALWNDIGLSDLVVVEAPSAPHGMACFVVDDAEKVPGLEFYASPRQYHDANDEDEDEIADFDRVEGRGQDEDAEDDDALDAADGLYWRLDFVAIDGLPMPDVGLWADLHLPVAGPLAYPVAIKPLDFGNVARPDAAQLAFFEAVLRALAETTEADIDSGRWTRTVGTADGAVTWRLSIPSLLDEPLEGQPGRDEQERSAAVLARFLDEGQFEDLDQAVEELQRAGRPKLEYQVPVTPAEKAQDLVYRSGAVLGRRRTQLLREALVAWPECPDAPVRLGENTRDPAKALALFEAGCAAAERAIDPGLRESLKGHYRENRQTRSYLRGLMGMATAHHRLGRVDEAVSEYRALMSLDDQDGARACHHLLALLLEEARDDEAGALLGEEEDEGPEWAYGWTLWAYRNTSRREATGILRIAQETNPGVARVLVSEALGAGDDWELGEWGAGEDADVALDEALDYVRLFGLAWERTDGAIEWLADELDRPRHRRGRNRRRGGRER